MRPALGVGRDDVEVRQQQERPAAGPVAAETGDDVAAPGERLEHGRREPRLGEHVRQVSGGQDLVARRVHRPQPQQGAEMADHLVEVLERVRERSGA